MTPSPSDVWKLSVAAPQLRPFPDSAAARPHYRWLIKALVIHALVIQISGCFIAIALVPSAGSSCNGCHLSAGKALGGLSGWANLLGFAITLMQTALSVAVYFLFRLVDRPPYRLRPLAIVLLAAYLLWPLLAFFLWLDAP
jgi:amino acid transporter